METTWLCPQSDDTLTMHGSSFVERHYHSSSLVRELYLVSSAGRNSLHSPLISNFPSYRYVTIGFLVIEFFHARA